MGTSIQLHSENRQEVEEETYIVFGCARGGTSMVSGCMVGLSLHMGNNLPQNYEDPEFVNQTHEHMIETIAKKNQHHMRWGWKFPEAAHYLNDIITEIRNPRLVIVFRDLVAIANNQNESNSINLWNSLVSNMLLQSKNICVAMQHNTPTLAISYEKAIADRSSFLEELAGFCNLALPEDTQPLTDFMNPGEYKATFADHYIG